MYRRERGYNREFQIVPEYDVINGGRGGDVLENFRFTLVQKHQGGKKHETCKQKGDTTTHTCLESLLFGEIGDKHEIRKGNYNSGDGSQTTKKQY